MQGFEHGEMGRGADAPGVRRETEEEESQTAPAPRCTAKLDQAGRPSRQHRGAFRLDLERQSARAAGPTAADDHRHRGAVELRQRDHHGRFDRMETGLRCLPLVERLEFHGMGREVGHVEPREQLDRRAGVVVGRPAHQRETGQRDHRVHACPTPVEKVRLDRGSRVETGGERRHDVEAAGLERLDDAVVVGGISREHVGPHEQEADSAASVLAGSGQLAHRATGAPRQPRVIEPDIAMRLGRGYPESAPEAAPRAVGVAVDERAHQACEVRVGAREPVLEHHEIGAHVLGGAGDEAQDARQLAQHP